MSIYTDLAMLYELCDPALAQSDLSKDDFFTLLSREIRSGAAFLFVDGEIVWYVRYVTPHLGDMHVMSRAKTAAISASLKRLWDACREHGLHKVEGRTHIPGFLPLARRCGMTLEGVRRSSYFDGIQFLDEYELGIVL